MVGFMMIEIMVVVVNCG